MRKVADVVYAAPDGNPLALDLYLPTGTPSAAPLIVYVHGGAWRSGSKEKPAIEPLTS